MAGVDFRGLRPDKLWPRRSRCGGAGAMRRTAPAWALAQFGREVFCQWRKLEVTKPCAGVMLLSRPRSLHPV